MQLLHRQGITIITITHFMREAVEGTRVIVLNEGAVAMDGPPWEVFAEVEKLRNLGLDIPPVTQLARRLHQRQPSLPGTLLTVEQVVEQLCTYRQAVQVEA